MIGIVLKEHKDFLNIFFTKNLHNILILINILF